MLVTRSSPGLAGFLTVPVTWPAGVHRDHLLAGGAAQRAGRTAPPGRPGRPGPRRRTRLREPAPLHLLRRDRLEVPQRLRGVGADGLDVLDDRLHLGGHAGERALALQHLHRYLVRDVLRHRDRLVRRALPARLGHAACRSAPPRSPWQLRPSNGASRCDSATPPSCCRASTDMFTETTSAERLSTIGLPVSSRISPRTDGTVTSRPFLLLAGERRAGHDLHEPEPPAQSDQQAATIRYSTARRRRDAGIISALLSACRAAIRLTGRPAGRRSTWRGTTTRPR